MVLQQPSRSKTHSSRNEAPGNTFKPGPVAYSKNQDSATARSSHHSVNTYASTRPSEEDSVNFRDYKGPITRLHVGASDAIPSVPEEFAALFPSRRRLRISHDDATSDGNMNLRVDTLISDTKRRTRRLSLFHLRMYSLQDRHFSFRRYYRESGREICSSICKDKANVLHSLGNAFQQLQLTQGGSVSNSERGTPPKTPFAPTNTIKLEFANYVQIEVSKRSTTYEYEYWGVEYVWKRNVYKQGNFQVILYQLFNRKTGKPIAHITPDTLSASEAKEEKDLGGWVPPCTMKIEDPEVYKSSTDATVAE